MDIMPNLLGDSKNVAYNFLGTLQTLGVLFIGSWLATKIEGKTLDEYGIHWNRFEWGNLLIGLCIGLLAFTLVVIPLYLSKTYILNRSDYLINGIINQFFLFISVGFIEEYLCRGYIQHRLLRFGRYPALISTSVIFSLLHLGNPGVSFLALINIALAGCFMGTVMYAFNSIHAAVGVHITWNWVQGAIFGIPVSGSEASGYFSTNISSNNTLVTGGKFGAEGSIICTFVMFILTIIFLLVANRNGNLDQFEKT